MISHCGSLRLLCLLACSVVACEAVSEESQPSQSSESALEVPADLPPVLDERSLVVTNPAALAEIEKRFSLGKLLERQGEAAATAGGMGIDEDGRPVPDPKGCDGKTCVSPVTANEWVDGAFRTAAEEIDAHSAAPAAARLGIVPVVNPMSRIRALWSGRNGTLDSKARPAPSLGDGPFRLLAVVNRLDLAGDVDARDCCVGAARVARPFGEGRLVFGLVDPTMEGRANPKPYPLTIIIEFRLPALGSNLNVLADDYPYKDALSNDATWRTQVERWGQVWQEQSRHAPRDARFQSRLAEIVARFAKPQNFLAIRSGFEVEDTAGRKEFEYREWYILRPNTRMIPRKPRREPYRCGSSGQTLTDIVEKQWDEPNNDLQMRGVNVNGRSISYDFPRDDASNPGQNGPMKGCPKDAKGKGIPFEMDGDAPGNGEARDIDTAPFARFGRADVWTMFEPKGDLAQREDIRHAFAIRTCSGCHGKEAGLFGFQISPRLKGQESTLADFMTGKGGNQFSHGGADYHYDDLRDRHAFLVSAAKRDPGLQLYASLRRHDRR